MIAGIEWYKVIVVYMIPIVLYIGFRKVYEELNKNFNMSHYTMAIIYVISGAIGLYFFTEPTPNSGEVSIWYDLWNMLLTSPIELGMNINILLLVYTFVAAPIFLIVISLVVIFTLLVNPKAFK